MRFRTGIVEALFRAQQILHAPVVISGVTYELKSLAFSGRDDTLWGAGTACALKPVNPTHLSLPSPSRHIYKSLTIAVAFSGSSAFDRVWQGSIKVDGTFA